ncbi:MAG TPA: hypothetical protein VMY15_03635 [Candidatus Latescibacteria bacterium]|nr:hypothetical protein [Candidatus Latescibacterota bacterium]
MGFGIIQGVDVLITPEAQREIEALRTVRPASSTWGILIGHKRGFRFFVEKVFPVAGASSAPSEREIASIDSVWPGRTIGLFAVRPSPAFRKALLGPMLYGKLFLRLDSPAGKGSARPFVVEFVRKFFLRPVELVKTAKAKAHE